MYPGPQARDRLAAIYRRQLWRQAGEHPFPSQADLWLAMEGWTLTDAIGETWEFDAGSPISDCPPDQFDVLRARYKAICVATDEERIVTDDEFWRLNPNYPKEDPLWIIDDSVRVSPLVERRLLTPRCGGPARKGAVLTGYKYGKSKVGGRYFAPTLLIPGVKGDLYGSEYDACSPEFEYILEALFSETGFNIPLKNRGDGHIYATSLQNRPRAGLMVVRLSNGAECTARSFERKEGLKGKERDWYLMCEYYQFPDFSAYTDIAQNLQARQGEVMFATTPDEAHIDVLRELGEDPDYPEWFVVPNVPRSANPYAFSFKEMEEQRKTTTLEKFKIAHMGILGQYVGSVYDYARGQRQFSVTTHPQMFKDPKKGTSKANVRIPDNWTVVGGADTGTMYSGVVAVYTDDEPPHLVFLDEKANYRYVATQIEQDKGYSINDWYRDIKEMSWSWGGDASFASDHNSQFKVDAFHSGGVVIYPGEKSPEARTEIFRSYFQHDRVWFAPWLEILPYEIEMARYPPKETSTGKWRRLSEKDHTLDPAEHIASVRAKPKRKRVVRQRTAIEALLGLSKRPKSPLEQDPHGL